jgi:transposase
MKGKKLVKVKAVRKKYTAEFKQKAVERSEKDGVPTVARDLGLAESQLYSWRSKLKETGQSFEFQKLQQAETARFKREIDLLRQENEFLKKAAAYFAKQPK